MRAMELVEDRLARPVPKPPSPPVRCAGRRPGPARRASGATSAGTSRLLVPGACRAGTLAAMGADASWLKDHIRDVADFPRPGIGFKDLTPLLGHAGALRFSVDALVGHFSSSQVDKVVGIEARGFIVAAPVAYCLRAGFVPVRKPGKLPWRVESRRYSLEYGSDCLEVHADALAPGDSVLVVDDVLATGGTAAAAVGLVERLGAEVVGLGVVAELVGLGGRQRLADHRVVSLISYETINDHTVLAVSPGHAAHTVPAAGR